MKRRDLERHLSAHGYRHDERGNSSQKHSCSLLSVGTSLKPASRPSTTTRTPFPRGVAGPAVAAPAVLGDCDPVREAARISAASLSASEVSTLRGPGASAGTDPG
jgi:hypothetical protein